MPKIYEYFGLIFYFHSNDHEPVHVHVKYNEFESKIEFELEDAKIVNIKLKKIRGINSIPDSKKSEAEIFVKTFGQQIIDKWIEFYVLKKKPKNEKITKKL